MEQACKNVNFGSYIPFNKNAVEPQFFSDSEQVALEDWLPCMLHQKCCEVMSKGWLKWLLLLMEKTWTRLEICCPSASLPARQHAEANSLTLHRLNTYTQPREATRCSQKRSAAGLFDMKTGSLFVLCRILQSSIQRTNEQINTWLTQRPEGEISARMFICKLPTAGTMLRFFTLYLL